MSDQSYEMEDGYATYADSQGVGVSIAGFDDVDNVIIRAHPDGVCIPVSTLRNMVREFERPERNLLAEQLDEQRARAEAAEARIKAARDLAEWWLKDADRLDKNAAMFKRDHARAVIDALDSPPPVVFEVHCTKCGDLRGSRDAEDLYDFATTHKCPGGAS